MRKRTRAGHAALRRGGALFLCTLTLWVLATTTDLQAAGQVVTQLTQNPAFLETVLQTELYPLPPQEGDPHPLERLALKQSAVLSTLPTGGTVPTNSPPPSPVATLSPSPSPVVTPPPTEGDSQEDPQILPQTTDGIVATTLLPRAGADYVSYGGTYIENKLGYDLDVAALAAAPLVLDMNQDAPTILIIHTHGTEAYTPSGTDTYTPTDPYRTLDCTQNMTAVGGVIADVLTEMGLQVLHDTTLYDYPDYNASYTNSGQAVARYLEEYPSIQVVLDVHRDALVGDDVIYKPVTTVNGQHCAQVMMVMGTDATYAHPHWLDNLSLAVKVQGQTDLLWPTLARPIVLRSSRYNQQLSAGSLLVEVGAHGNTLEEAKAGAALFARSLGAALLSEK